MARAHVLAAATELAKRRDESVFTHLQDALTAIDALDDFLGDGEVIETGLGEPAPLDAAHVIDLTDAKARLIERRRAERRREP